MSIFATQYWDRIMGPGRGFVLQHPGQVETVVMEETITCEKSPVTEQQLSLWYAVYTRSRSEKRLMELLTAKGIEAYVPLRKVFHQWSDRKRLVEEPLIRSYCFVKVGTDRYYDVLNTPGAVRYIWFSGKPAMIPERQIDLLKTITASDLEVECLPDTFSPGMKVRIIAGPLAGLSGELVTLANKKKVLIRIDQLNQVITVNISAGEIEVAR